MKILKEISNINKAAAEAKNSPQARTVSGTPLTQEDILLKIARYKKIIIALIEFGEIFTNDEADEILDEIQLWLDSLPTE